MVCAWACRDSLVFFRNTGVRVVSKSFASVWTHNLSFTPLSPSLIRVPAMPVRHPTGSVTMGTAKKNVQRSHAPGSVPNAVGRVSASHDRGKLKLQPQNGTFFFRCIICVSTEKTAHTQIRTLARQHAPHRPPERKSERESKREDSDLGHARNEMENSRKSVSTQHSAVSNYITLCQHDSDVKTVECVRACVCCECVKRERLTSDFSII